MGGVFLSEIIEVLDRIFNVYTISFAFIVALISLLIDVPDLKKKNQNKEGGILTFISIMYIFIGIAATVFLR